MNLSEPHTILLVSCSVFCMQHVYIYIYIHVHVRTWVIASFPVSTPQLLFFLGTVETGIEATRVRLRLSGSSKINISSQYCSLEAGLGESQQLMEIPKQR